MGAFAVLPGLIDTMLPGFYLYEEEGGDSSSVKKIQRGIIKITNWQVAKGLVL